MSHLVNMIRNEPSHIERIKKAHTILMMEAESTTEILIWNDPESVEAFMDEVRRLISSIIVPQEDLDDLESDGRSFNKWREKFVMGLDEFVVNVYRGIDSGIFVNTARVVVHYAWMYLEGRK